MNSDALKARLDELKKMRADTITQGQQAQQVVERCGQALMRVDGGIAELERLLAAPDTGGWHEVQTA